MSVFELCTDIVTDCKGEARAQVRKQMTRVSSTLLASAASAQQFNGGSVGGTVMMFAATPWGGHCRGLGRSQVSSPVYSFSVGKS